LPSCPVTGRCARDKISHEMVTCRMVESYSFFAQVPGDLFPGQEFKKRVTKQSRLILATEQSGKGFPQGTSRGLVGW
jgi:hypothetical protein